MKYDVHDGEIVIHQRDSDVFLPLSLAEMQHVVDVMNLHETIKASGIAPIVPSGMMEAATALLDNVDEAE